MNASRGKGSLEAAQPWQSENGKVGRLIGMRYHNHDPLTSIL